MDNSEPESSEDSELYEKLAGEGCLAKKVSFLLICGRYTRGLFLLVTQNHKLLMTPRSSVVKIRSTATMPATDVAPFLSPPIYNLQWWSRSKLNCPRQHRQHHVSLPGLLRVRSDSIGSTCQLSRPAFSNYGFWELSPEKGILWSCIVLKGFEKEREREL